MADFRLAPGPGVLDLCLQTQWPHGGHHPPCGRCVSTCGDEVPGPGAHISPAADARLGASSLLTSYSVRGGRVCSLKRVDPSKVMSEVSLGGLGLTPRPPPSIGLMASAGRPAAWPRQAEGRTIEVESSSLAPRASPRDRVTTPAGREEPGTSLYSSYTDPPHAPRPGRCQEATSGVSCTPASPDPGGSGPASSPSSPPGPAPAAGANVGAVGARGI